jgi:hypothetical protein
MFDIYSITVIIGIYAYICYQGYMLWKEAHEK